MHYTEYSPIKRYRMTLALWHSKTPLIKLGDLYAHYILDCRLEVWNLHRVLRFHGKTYIFVQTELAA